MIKEEYVITILIPPEDLENQPTIVKFWDGDQFVDNLEKALIYNLKRDIDGLSIGDIRIRDAIWSIPKNKLPSDFYRITRFQKLEISKILEEGIPVGKYDFDDEKEFYFHVGLAHAWEKHGKTPILVAFVRRSFWKKEGSLEDQYLTQEFRYKKMNPLFLVEDTSGIFLSVKNNTVEEIEKLLLEMGFLENQEFSDWCKNKHPWENHG